jgi:hypothetical protein
MKIFLNEMRIALPQEFYCMDAGLRRKAWDSSAQRVPFLSNTKACTILRAQDAYEHVADERVLRQLPAHELPPGAAEGFWSSPPAPAVPFVPCSS